MRRLGNVVFTATALSVASAAKTTTNAKQAYYYAFRRYATDHHQNDSIDQHKTDIDDNNADSSEGEKREFAKMDVSTNNFTVGKFKGVENTAIAQEENLRSMPAGVAQRVHDEGCGCAGTAAHDVLQHPHSMEPADAESVSASSSSSSVFGRIFNQEAAAMISGRIRNKPADPLSAAASSSAAPSSLSASAKTEKVSAATPTSEQHIFADVGPFVDSSLTHKDILQKQHEAAVEMQRFLAQNTLRSIQRSVERESAEAGKNKSSTSAAGSRSGVHVHTADTRLPPGRRGVQALLDYNKQWAAEVSHFNPRYFRELAKEQKPEYLWIGCSDSRVPANEVIGLHPGDVFVHRNIGNIFSLSDLNCLSALQFAVDCLKVQHVIIAGHYKCGGVTAAMNGTSLGLTDHWIMQVTDIKNKFWDRVTMEIPEEDHLNVLCELNVLQQLSHAANCRVVQRLWKAQNDEDRFHRGQNRHIFVRQQYARTHHLAPGNLTDTHPGSPHEVECHGWVYSLDDGILRPLLSLTRLSDVKKQIEEATEAVFVRYSSR